VQTIRWSAVLRTSEKQNVHQLDPNTQVVFSTSRSTNDYSCQEIDVIQRAADFLFNCCLFVEAFPLYEMIWRRNKNCPDGSLKGTKALIACVRCAVTDADLQTIGESVAQALTETEITRSWMDFEALILRTLQMIVYERQGNRDNRGNLSDMGATTPAVEDVLSTIHQGNTGLDLLTYCCLSLGFCFRSTQFPTSWRLAVRRDFLDENTEDLRSSRQNFLEQDPGIFALQYGSMMNSSIRSSIEWCRQEINPQPIYKHNGGTFAKAHSTENLWDRRYCSYTCGISGMQRRILLPRISGTG